MEQSDSMLRQIGSVIANEILKNREIYLPQIGSLKVKSTPSKINSSTRSIAAPTNVVVYFEKEVLGESIVDVIRRVGECDLPTAEGLYTKWRETASNNGRVEIINVGVIANGNFEISPSLEAKINTDTHKVVLPQKRRKGGWLWIVASILGCVVIGFIINGVMSYYQNQAKVVVETPAPVIVEQPDTVERVVEAPVERVLPKDLKYRVVYGVFSNMENAQKGVELAKSANPDIVAWIYPHSHNQLFLVSIFESKGIEDCQAFVEANDELYEDLWINIRNDI